MVWARKMCGVFRPALAEIDDEIFETKRLGPLICFSGSATKLW